MKNGNSKLIENFIQSLSAEGIGKYRIVKYTWILNFFSKRLKKDFREITQKDLKKFFSDIENEKIKSVKKGKGYSLQTKNDFKICAKRFWKWLKPDSADEKKYPIEVRWLRTGIKKSQLKIIRSQTLLNEQDIEKMINVAPSIRDKCIIAMFFESGIRIGELKNLKVNDIVFDDMGFNFVSRGKTGEGYSRIVNPRIVGLMRDWIKLHPFHSSENFKDMPLWVLLRRANHGFKQLDDSGIRKMLREVGKLAGMTKKVNPHWIRHSAIQNFDMKKIPRPIIEKMVKWQHGSKMWDTYERVSSEEIDRALVDAFGMKEDLQQKQQMNKLDDVLTNLMNTDSKFKKFVMEKIQKELKENE